MIGIIKLMAEQKPAQKKEDEAAASKKEIATQIPMKPETKAPPKPEIKPALKVEQKPLPKPPKKIMQRIADLKELAIAIDSFEDLFSDFDPREYEKRDLSDDFIREIQKRYREPYRKKVEVIFHAPKALHNEKLEKIIVQRIKQCFRASAQENKNGVAALRFRGSLYIIFGLGLLSLLTFLAYGKILSDFHIELLSVAFLPLGWFGVWEGFSKIVDIPYELRTALELNTKLSKANYQFKFLE
ncbi:MAG: hypothetical protein KKA19_00890 [Candidatus Margulisbacteria bacterium]|nr:hypothetical protein [Candidatus Margulisiibacteriota bacterium]